MLEILRLLGGSVLLRPYVYAFFLCFLFFAIRHMGLLRTVLFFVSTYAIAFFCEYSSTRNGFPFGLYTYIDTTRTKELWISNVPCWDSLSFVFLSYFSWLLAGFTLSKGRDLNSGLMMRATPWFGGVLMMLLDIVIDPVALQGHKWFLGQIYFYPDPGPYFGVTLANFAGWFFVGFATQWVFIGILRILSAFGPLLQRKFLKPDPNFAWGVFGVYAGVFFFNLGITVWICEYKMALASALLIAATLSFAGFFLKDRVHNACRS